MHEYTRVNAKVNYIRGRTRRNGCSSNNLILLCKRSQQNEIIIIINGTEVFGQMRKLWRLAERKGETCSGSRNGQSNRIWDRSGGWNRARHGLQSEALTQGLVNFSQGTAKLSHNCGRRRGPENTFFKCSLDLWMKEQRKQVLERNFGPLLPGNGKISLETVKNN